MRALVLILLLALPAHADRLPLLHDQMLREPGQKALIAWNGTEQVMVLTTVLQSSRPVEGLELLPLPSKPEVSLAPEGYETTLERVVRQHLGDPPTRGGSAITLVAQTRIGAHDLTVLEIRDVKDLSEWVRGYYEARDWPARPLPPHAIHTVDSYVKAGCRYLVLDRVELAPGKPTQVQPVVYRFKTDRLFYPLRTSNLVEGEGAVSLFLATATPSTGAHEALAACLPPLDLARMGEDFAYEFERERWDWWGWDPLFEARDYREVRSTRLVELPAAELSALCPEAAALFQGTVYLRGVRYWGPLRFSRDLWWKPQINSAESRNKSELKPPTPSGSRSGL